MAQPKAITEREIRRLAREGVMVIDTRGAIVTPGAVSAARELGVHLSGPETPTSAVAMRAYGSHDGARETHTTIAICCDVAGAAIKDAVATRLYELTHTVIDLAKGARPPTGSPDVALAVAQEVAAGRAPVGIVIDNTGITGCIAANKVRGIRAALCHDVTSAVSAREHTDANVLCLAGSLIGPRLALAIVETFLTKEFAAARYADRLARLKEIDRHH